MEKQDSYKYYNTTPFLKGVFLRDYYAKKVEVNPFNITVNRAIKNLDLATLKGAFKYMIERHEVFRTIFENTNDSIKLKVCPYNENVFEFEYFDITKETKKEAILQKKINDGWKTTFNLKSIPWLNVKILKLTDIEYSIIITIPHFISDGQSIGVFLKELTFAYKCLIQKIEINLAKPLQFGEYLNYTNELFKNNEKRYKQFWKAIFEELPKNNLSTKYVKNNVKREMSYVSFLNKEFDIEYGYLPPYAKNSFMGNVLYIIPKKAYKIDFVINSDAITYLNEIVESANVNLQILLIATFILLITRLTGEKEALIGINTNIRDRDETKEMIGFMLNTIFLRHKLKRGQSYIEYLQDVNISYIRTLRYKKYSVDQTLYDSDISFEQVGSLFLNIMDNRGQTMKLRDNDKFIHNNRDLSYAYFDIDFNINIYNNGISFQCQFKDDLFETETVEYILNQYLILLKELKNYSSIIL